MVGIHDVDLNSPVLDELERSEQPQNTGTNDHNALFGHECFPEFCRRLAQTSANI
jgi:hypothetical protein